MTCSADLKNTSKEQPSPASPPPSAEETSAEETSAEETSAEETSAEETSAEETSAAESVAESGAPEHPLPTPEMAAPPEPPVSPEMPAEEPEVLSEMPQALLEDITAADPEPAPAVESAFDRAARIHEQALAGAAPAAPVSPFERAERIRAEARVASPDHRPDPGGMFSPALSDLAQPPKDRAIAVVLEALPGLFGLLGIGWIYADKTVAGLVLLFAYLGWTIVAVVLDVVTVGIFLLCLHLPLHVGAVALSSFILYRHTKNHPETFGN